MDREKKELNRRQFLTTTTQTIAGAVLATGSLNFLNPSTVMAAVQNDDFSDYDLVLPRVKIKCHEHAPSPWNACPGGDKNLLTEFSKVVRCKAKLQQNCNNYNPTYGSEEHFNAVVDLTDINRLKKFPILLMTSEGHYTLEDKKKQNLKQYIEEGGFVIMDDCVFDMVGDFFYQDSYKLLEELFGPGSVQKISRDHEIFHNVFDLGEIGLPHLWGQNHGARGVFLDGRLAVFLSSTDLHCAWTDRGNQFRNVAKTRNFGKNGFEEAIQMGINILMYALSH